MGRRRYIANRFLSTNTVGGLTYYARYARLARARSSKNYQAQLTQTVFSSRTVPATCALLRYVPCAGLSFATDTNTPRMFVQTKLRASPDLNVKNVLLSPAKRALMGEQYKKENEKCFASSGVYTKKFSTLFRNKICAAQHRRLVSASRKPETLAPSVQRFAY